MLKNIKSKATRVLFALTFGLFIATAPIAVNTSSVFAAGNGSVSGGSSGVGG